MGERVAGFSTKPALFISSPLPIDFLGCAVIVSLPPNVRQGLFCARKKTAVHMNVVFKRSAVMSLNEAI